MPIWIRRTQNLHQTLNVDFGVRFQCKLALGFGHALFGQEFAAQPYAGALRAGLCHRYGRGDPPPLIGKGFWGDGEAGFTAQFANEGAFTLLFTRAHEGAWLSVFMPTGKSTHTLILPGDELLSSALFSQYSSNFVVLIFPAIKRHVGPLPAFSYVMHRNGQRLIPELLEIEANRKTLVHIEAEVAKYAMSADMAA